jgi:putative transposase
MDLVEDIADPRVSVVRACAALGVSRATLYRGTMPSVPQHPREHAPSPRRLADAERAAVLDVLHSPELADQPPHEVYALLLSRGIYLASIRTMYRILAEAGETQERRAQRRPHAYAKPSLTATGPNQVWTWDITKLATTSVGVFLHAYVIIDLFSRYVVGWMVATKECKHLAAQLFAETIARHGIEPGLTLHADRGSAMKSDTLAQLLATLGVQRSFSRPHVSDDNAFSESLFKTVKYQPDYPGRFDGVLHGRGWLGPLLGWHNDDHHHSGLALFTPADVFFGRVEAVRAVRQAALDGAYAAHPERFPRGAPRVALPPTEVSINPLGASTAVIGGGDALSSDPTKPIASVETQPDRHPTMKLAASTCVQRRSTKPIATLHAPPVAPSDQKPICS